jgi:integrase
MKLKTINRRIPTKEEGVFYKDIVDENSKAVDKIYLVRYRENGKDRLVTIGKHSQGIRLAFCKKKRNEFLNNVRLGEDVQVQTKQKKAFTFENAFEHYIEWAKENKKTWKHNDYQVYHKHLAHHVGHKSLTSLKPTDFENLKQIKTKEEYKPKTVHHILATARHIINYAIKHELVKNYTNPIANGRVRMPKVDNAKAGFLTREQADKLLDILKENNSKTLYRLTILLLYTGARFSEITTLRWDHINFANRLIYFKPTKDGNPRHIYITDRVLEILEELRDEQSCELVIPSKNNKQIDKMPRQWQSVVDEMLPNNKNADKFKITPHSLRHTHASWLALSGMGILQIKEQLGHKKLDMTMRYSHLIPDERHRQTIEVFY